MTTILALERLSGCREDHGDRKVRSIPASKMNLLPAGRTRLPTSLWALWSNQQRRGIYPRCCHSWSEENFADMMNEKAREIGALNTHFRNASGLYVGDHYSTCWDLALIFRYALSNEQFREIVSTRSTFSSRAENRISATQTTTGSSSASSRRSAARRVLHAYRSTVT